MKRWIVKGALCASLWVGLSGCMVSSGPLNADEAILGTWSSDESVAVYDISRAADGRLEILGHSTLSGREIMISDVSWDGKVLKFKSYVPATDHRAEREARLINSKTMKAKIFSNGEVYEYVFTKTGQGSTGVSRRPGLDGSNER
ncbi:MAG: hypothetical protein GXY61_03275 [Lentisphaerae bacterium]|nr:hypothetical protein [Lentisphaerota bacterium]